MAVVAAVIRRRILTLAATLLTGWLGGGCGQGCDVQPPVVAPPVGEPGTMVTRLTPHGLAARGQGLARALAALPPSTFRIVAYGAEGDLSCNALGQCTRFHYGTFSTHLTPAEGRYEYDEDGQLLATLHFAPVQVTVEAYERDRLGGLFLGHCDVTVEMREIEARMWLEPWLGPVFRIVDANIVPGPTEAWAQEGCEFDTIEPVHASVAAALAREIKPFTVHRGPLSSKILDLTPGLLGLELERFRAYRISSSLPPTADKRSMAHGLAPAETVSLDAAGLDLAVTAGFLDVTLDPPQAGPVFPELAPDGEPYDFALAIRRAHIQQGLEQAFVRGLFDLDLGTGELPSQMTTRELAEHIPELAAFAPDAPFFLRLRPSQPPEILSSGSGLVLDLGSLRLDLYVEIDGASIRALGGTAGSARLQGGFRQGPAGPEFAITGYQDNWAADFSELFGERAGAAVAGFDEALAALFDELRETYLSTTLPLPFSDLIAARYRGFEIKGDSEPYLYLYLDLDAS